MDIPFNKIHAAGNEIEYISNAMKRGKTSSGGYYCKEVEKFVESKFGARKAFFTSSCSAALDASAVIIGLENEDEVIMPSFTFSSTANAVLARGAKPVFVDIEKVTFDMDVDDVKAKITAKTKAIYPVHYAGISCDMEAITSIASRHGLKVVEDAAQGVGSMYGGEYLGTMGNIGCLSFHETKNVTCGEGGCLLMNDSTLDEIAEIVLEKGTNRTKFLNGEIDKYTWVGLGSSYLGSEIAAAYLLAQLEEMDTINRKRRVATSNYYEFFRASKLVEEGHVVLPSVPWEMRSNYHAFVILLKDEKTRNETIVKMKEKGIAVASHFVPLHSSPMGRSLGYEEDDCPITEEVSKRLLRLPMHTGLSTADCQKVVARLEECLA